MKKSITTILLCSVMLAALGQKIDTINVGHKFKNIASLEMGEVLEVSHTTFQGKKNLGAFKVKTVSEVEIDGKKYLEFRHRWISGKEEMNGGFYSLCEPETLRPIVHIRETKKMGKEAFEFGSTYVKAIDSVENNAVKDFRIDAEVPTFNWEIDIETYSLLPMKVGYKAAMNFYHAGGPAPKYYLLEVEGSEAVVLPNGQTIDCWVIFTDYGGVQPTRFWYTKKGQKFIKMEGKYGQVEIFKSRLF